MVAAAVAAGWLGASLAQPPAAGQSPSNPTGPRPIGSPAAVPRAETLRDRVVAPPLPSRGRNPFVFGTRATNAPTPLRGRPEAPIEEPALSAEALPPMPVFKLSGIASTEDGGATVLTAILNDNGALVIAKAGDKLSNGYSVLRVDEMSVTLTDANGITQTIRLP